MRSIIEDEVEEAPATRGKRRRSSVGADHPEAVAPKRKRRGPPGIPAAQFDGANEKEGTIATKRSASNRRAEPSGAGPSEDAPPSTSRRSSPRKRGRPPKATPQASSSADELLLVSPAKKGRGRRGKKDGSSPENAMDVDEGPVDPPSPFGEASILNLETVPDTLPEIAEPAVPDTPAPDPSSEMPPPLPLPAHRVRAANPRIKQTDDPNLTETHGAIAVKAQFMKRGPVDGDGSGEVSRSARVSRSRAGPGRSSDGLLVGGSRLTVQKGKLTTVKPRKAKNVQEEVPAVPAEPEAVDTHEQVELLVAEPTSPPTAQDLFKAAGFTATEGDLPDFEADAEGEIDPDYVMVPE